MVRGHHQAEEEDDESWERVHGERVNSGWRVEGWGGSWLEIVGGGQKRYGCVQPISDAM